MHEMSVMAQVFEIIEKKAAEHNLNQVTKVVLKIGEFTCIEESALQFAFEAFAQETRAEGAELIINWVEAVARCENCGAEFKVSFTDKVCPVCSQFAQNIVSGYELLLTQLEGE